MPTWPGGLPQNPEWTGYQESPPNETIRSPMDVGPPKQRRRTTTGVRTIQLPMKLTRTEVATLDAFYRSTLGGGALAFDWIHPRTLAAASFRFTAPPEYVPLGTNVWSVRLPLEILP